MNNHNFFKEYTTFVTFCNERYGKATLFENELVLVGLNCFEPGQAMEKHAHTDQYRFYVVLEGRGQIRVGEEEEIAKTGAIVWVPSGFAHRIINNTKDRLVLLVGIFPSNAD